MLQSNKKKKKKEGILLRQRSWVSVTFKKIQVESKDWIRHKSTSNRNQQEIKQNIYNCTLSVLDVQIFMKYTPLWQVPIQQECYFKLPPLVLMEFKS